MRFITIICLSIANLCGGEKWIPEYIWNLGIAMQCDITPFNKGLPANYITTPPPSYTDPEKYIKDVQKGDIIWVQSARLPTFIKKVFPKIKNPFVLVVTDGDESFPSYAANKVGVYSFVNSSRVLHLFAQNIDQHFKNGKVTHLPIGIDFHSMAKSQGAFGEHSASVQSQARELDHLLSTLAPTTSRKKKALIDFHLNDWKIPGGGTRGDVARIAMQNGMADLLQSKIPRSELWKLKGEYAFSISPHGNGLDCHRTWEDLVLGCIVIVKTSPLDAMYQGLPVVIINDWSEINEENFDKWLNTFGDVFSNPAYREKLTTRYWMNLIRTASKRY